MNTFAFPQSAFAPIAVGFFGLGTGFLIYGAQELFRLPERNRAVDLTTGIWGISMPGFMQFLTGMYLWAGLAWFDSFRAPVLYMTALAFTAYGVHWFALGLSRILGGDPRPNEFMAIAFLLLSVLGVVVLFKAGDWPVALVFVGLCCVYVSEFFAGLFTRIHGANSQADTLNALGERALGMSRLTTGAWLMYLTFATTLNVTSGTNLPV
ncbi:MAG TPA: hypothetical protein VKE51_15985 [Vicinamibacterales bacterium]|nr:hypothetical protein [Vicinamibacterales bacterium]